MSKKVEGFRVHSYEMKIDPKVRVAKRHVQLEICQCTVKKANSLE